MTHLCMHMQAVELRDEMEHIPRNFLEFFWYGMSGGGMDAYIPYPTYVSSVPVFRYLEMVSELLQTVRQMENTLNKRRVTGRSRSSRAGAVDQGPSDKDKIMMQARSMLAG